MLGFFFLRFLWCCFLRVFLKIWRHFYNISLEKWWLEDKPFLLKWSTFCHFRGVGGTWRTGRQVLLCPVLCLWTMWATCQMARQWIRQAMPSTILSLGLEGRDIYSWVELIEDNANDKLQQFVDFLIFWGDHWTWSSFSGLGIAIFRLCGRYWLLGGWHSSWSRWQQRCALRPNIFVVS